MILLNIIFQVCTDKVTHYFVNNETIMEKKLSKMFLHCH